ncbi:MAG: LysR family transcriptional regulator [Pseudomonas mandelii]|uniref:LysR family transcriptional regulator n=1 Tax=Pseudomonas violetae TaxID=2915813 RepID=A0ABT0ESM1_9PSED|nr:MULTISPECIES: LysR family transcriptional regulator [Pseudomonas]KAF0864006.1 LysR family transcriptional regulator [Pseudomonas sp. LD120]MCK1788735.1 LysR family transcriptional regulator [Pseudomonas violetae]
MIDDLRSMAVFATVVAEGSFRGAATRLGLSASVISHHVSRLESRLDCALLYRSTRRLSLTDDGRVFHEACARALDAAEEGLNSVANRQSELKGRLRIGAPAMLASGPFVDDVLAFADAYPAVELELCLDDDRKNQIEAGFDVSIRIGWLKDSALRARQLFTVQRRLCAAPELIERMGVAKHPADLLNWPWVYETMLPSFIDLTGPQNATYRVPIAGRLSTNHAETAKRFALAGAGAFASLDFFVFKELASGQIVELLPDWQLSSAGVYAVWPSNVSRNSLSMRFVDFLHTRVNAMRAQDEDAGKTAI